MWSTASHEQPISLETVVLSVRWANQPTMSSKSRVCLAPARAQGTCSVRTRPHDPTVDTKHVRLDEHPGRAEVHVPPPPPGRVITSPRLGTAGAHQLASAATPQTQHEALIGELDRAHRCCGQLENTVKCSAD